MIAEFYLLAESFIYDGFSSVSEIEEKIEALGSDYSSIKEHGKSNKIFVHSEIYEIQFINGFTITQLLFEPSSTGLNRDARNMLQKIIIESQETLILSEEVKEVLLLEHSEDVCHGLIAFNIIPNLLPEYQIVYNTSTWLDFRRYYLGLYPKNPEFFISECEKYFPELFFHKRNVQTIASIFNDCPRKILYHLSALNDKFKDVKDRGNRTQVLTSFSAYAQLDETASLEGNAARKPSLTFEFTNSKSESIKVCCEPHLKLCYNDNHPGDSSYSTNRRIYFHEGMKEVADGKILIGHIGEHL
ncbi:hypothetical protein ACLI08_04420 [Flavobacterium sp. RNTU_13]|uniref:hypothetical protein n=1 Tax=Flavobacterium sp. RNTU_13 TaxID=3375145 RepID=UPI003987464A